MVKFPVEVTVVSSKSGFPWQILFRRDTTEKWDKFNPVLGKNEMGLDLDIGMIKIGDGKKSWKDLNYLALVEAPQKFKIPKNYKVLHVSDLEAEGFDLSHLTYILNGKGKYVVCEHDEKVGWFPMCGENRFPTMRAANLAILFKAEMRRVIELMGDK